MLVFLEQSLIIYAPPKTGTTALHMALTSRADMVFRGKAKHIPVRKAQRRLIPLVESFNIPAPQGFAIIREPIDWLHSWYRYRKRDDVPVGRSTKNIRFDNFIEAYLQEDRPEFARVGQQAKFLGANNLPPVEHLFAYEHLDRAIGFLFKRLGFEFQLDWVNESPEAALEISNKNRDLLRDFFAEDYAIHERATKYALGFEPPR